MKMSTMFLVAIMVLGLGIVGCTKDDDAGSPDDPKPGVQTQTQQTPETQTPVGPPPVFWLDVSEYPSWSLFLTAHDQGFVNLEEGKVGPIEKIWGIDLAIKETDYDTCIALYGSGKHDGACLTNMDSLAPSLQIPSVAILPTSTSFGADQLIVRGSKYKTLEDLKGVPVYGLENSVSHYLFDAEIENAGMNPEDFDFKMMDPAAAATAFIQGKVDAIVVWNPFCMEVAKQVPDAKVIFSSKGIPNEIVDMVTVSRASLAKEGGENFACAVVHTYYIFCKTMQNLDTRDEALVALGKRFSKLGLEDMELIVEETQFYGTPDLGIGLFTGKDLPKTMIRVSNFCLKRDIVPSKPTLGYGKGTTGNLVFDPQYMQRVAKKMKDLGQL